MLLNVVAILILRKSYTYTDDEQNPTIYEYEGSWDFTAADGTIGISWESDFDDAYEWDFDIESVSETIFERHVVH